MFSSHLLSLILWTPALGALLLCLLPGRKTSLLRASALLFTGLTFLLSLLLWGRFQEGTGQMQLVENLAWIEVGSFQARYHLGVDGISLLLVLLTTFLMPLAVLASWSIREQVKPYLALMLFLEVGMIGVFLSLDLVLFYIFWEVMLIPMYFLIGVWGGERRVYAAVKFFLYTMAGSLLMLAAIIALYFQHGDLDLVRITERLAREEVVLSQVGERLLFLAFFLAFAIKVPLFPFHTWLPDAHVEAPTAGSVILAGVLLKMGTYGLLRFCLPLFPQASIDAAPLICGLALVGILYGALVAMVQPDVKKLVAYSSVSHLGLVVLGIFAFNLTSLQGATYQMLNHGLSTGALFILVGMLYDRRHTRQIASFGGIAHSMPVFAALFLVVVLSSIGLPGLNGFIGEFLTLQGTFLERPYAASLGALGIILSAVYMLWMYQRVFLGRVNRAENRQLLDLNVRERLTLVPILLLVLWMGVYPSPFLRKMELSLQRVVERIEQAEETEIFRVEYRERP